ncbi:MAG: type II toxin-antitoxin system HicA family toxin [Planctomycetes bacterium]|nr:type II toxin-antitoxin system HicA family toxin [Planctomycetota bacterium]
MKRIALLKHLRKHGCYLKREGRSHSLWCNPLTGHSEAIPHHTEISNKLARKICKALSIKDI